MTCWFGWEQGVVIDADAGTRTFTCEKCGRVVVFTLIGAHLIDDSARPLAPVIPLRP